jgi:mono/diheme cytochrome c family protein
MQPALRGLSSPANLLFAALLAFGLSICMAAQTVDPHPTLRIARTSPADLELGGELAGAPLGSTRFLNRDDLLALPQVTYTVSDDANFTGPVQIGGVPLEELIRKFAANPGFAMAIALCDDQYRANYPQEYIAKHRPLLVLTVNGKPPSGWPKDSETHQLDMGPYLISHPSFTPAFKVLSHADEAQIPWGVIRLDFRNENTVFDAIAPHGPQAQDKKVQDGYRIVKQNCFRCHNNGKEGGTKAGHPWLVLSAWATASPDYFTAYVRSPQSKNPRAQMPGNPGYDDSTIAALIAYFRTFSPATLARDNEKP